MATNKLIPLIKEYGYTLEEFANICEVSLKTLYNWNNSGIVNKEKHRILLKKLIPEFEPVPRTRTKKVLTEEQLQKLKPRYNNHYKRKLPQCGIKVKIIKKGSKQ